METEKGMRLLYLYQALTEGRGIQKQEAAIRFCVNERSIQRDIEGIRNFLSEQNPPMEVRYVAAKKAILSDVERASLFNLRRGSCSL